MNAHARIAKGTRLCQRLAEDVTVSAPAGLGTWNRTWEIVGPDSTEFLVKLTTWEASGDASILPELRAAYDRVLEAWRVAADEYGKVTR